MMKRIIFFALTFLTCNFSTAYSFSSSRDENNVRLALVVVPVADVLDVGPMMDDTSSLRYKQLPYSWGYARDYDCPRFHQLLFNQVVSILEESAYEYKVEISNLYYQTLDEETPHPFNGWVLKDNLLEIEHIRNAGLSLEHLPLSLPGSRQQNTLALTEPYFDNEKQLRYSAGTRFVIYNESLDSYTVYTFDSDLMQYALWQIPKKHVFAHTYLLNKAEQRAAFITLIKQWATRQSGFIPYLQGGASVCEDVTHPNFKRQPLINSRGDIVIEDERIRYGYTRPYENDPHTGLDCSSLIWLAAQTVDIPFFCKNSSTLCHQLAPYEEGMVLLPGDILWFPGHVMVISGVDELTLIQSEGYGSRTCSGGVTEDCASSLFSNISTVEDLIKEYLLAQPLFCKNSKGDVVSIQSQWKLYRFESYSDASPPFF